VATGDDIHSHDIIFRFFVSISSIFDSHTVNDVETESGEVATKHVM
jgi:hypothetical protein